MSDAVHHPPHYTVYKPEIIEITKHLPFCLGNVVKYVMRAPYKNGLQDLEKAMQYLDWCFNGPVVLSTIDAMDLQKALEELSAFLKRSSVPYSVILGMFIAALYRMLFGGVSIKTLRHSIEYLRDSMYGKQLAELDNSGPMRIYLAAPYTSHLAAKRKERYRLVSRYAAKLMVKGNLVFSPVTHSHPLAEQFGCVMPDDKWQPWYLSYLEHWANALYVLKLPDWEKSKGVATEIDFAKAKGIPIVMLGAKSCEE